MPFLSWRVLFPYFSVACNNKSRRNVGFREPIDNRFKIKKKKKQKNEKKKRFFEQGLSTNANNGNNSNGSRLASCPFSVTYIHYCVNTISRAVVPDSIRIFMEKKKEKKKNVSILDRENRMKIYQT